MLLLAACHTPERPPFEARFDAAGAHLAGIDILPSGRLGVEERWARHDFGFEQSWTVYEQADDVVIDVQIRGAEVGRRGENLRLVPPAGPALSVTGLAAWDATGRTLPARFEVERGGFSVNVDAIGARFPVEIDPIYATASTTLTAESSDRFFAYVVAGVGDVDADGFDDVLVGAMVHWEDDAVAYVYDGSTSGLTEFASVTLTGEDLTSCSQCADGAGDVNGDGIRDVIVSNGDDRAYLYLGTTSGPSATPSGTLTGTSGDLFGAEVAGAGDVDGDGLDDVLVGAYGYRGYTGRAFVYLGDTAGVDDVADATLDGPAVRSYFAADVAGGGDIDADGYADVVIGAATDDATYVYAGSPSGTPATPSNSLTGIGGEGFGSDVAILGDTDGDGFDDVAIGASACGSGCVYVHSGSSGGLSSAASATLMGSDIGGAVAAAGDVNDDGFRDLLVGASRYGPYSEGQVSVFLGASSGMTAVAAMTDEGGYYQYLGGSVAGAGDVDGDGFADVFVGSDEFAYLYAGSSGGPSGDPTVTLAAASLGELGEILVGAGDLDGDGFPDAVLADSSRIYVHAGSAGGLAAAGETIYLEHPASEWVTSLAAGDADGDGHRDLLVGVDAASTRGARFFPGSGAGLTDEPTTSLEGDDYFGYAVALDGDIDGDGFADAVIGAWPASSLATGHVYIFGGGARGLSSTVTTTVTAAAVGYFGEDVTYAGDVDGDGFDDVLVGSRMYASNSRAELFSGGAAGLDTTAAVELDWGLSSVSLSVAGDFDVDADGYADVIVGSPTRADVHHGSASGLSSTAALILSGIGETVSGAGDVDADGFDDVLIASDGTPAGNGQVQLHVGSAGGLSATALVTLSGTAKEGLGYALTPLGDVDADGFDDVLLGTDDAGVAYVHRGYADADGDGYASTEDCDDTDRAVRPDATETCNGIDDNCDGLTDDASATGKSTGFRDGDGDGYGDPAEMQEACELPADYIEENTDCDDTIATVNPGGTETCNSVDDDCDGTVDEEAIDPSDWYADADGDGFGDGTALSACDPPADHVADSTDCDDTDASVNPGGTETCNSVDDDCDGDIDEDGGTAWYPDTDGDGFGAGTAVTACDPPADHVADATDCDDGDASVSPGGTETCNSMDDDCDGDIDEDGGTAWYPDGDGDGYGGPEGITTCDPPSTYIADSTDCEDTDASVSPGSTETCNSVDDDCDGDIDEDAIDPTTAYPDTDGDGYGDAGGAITSCDPPSTYIADATDCDDTDASVNPGATETCNSADDDCDGDIDEDGGTAWYPDADGDGFGGPDGITTCDPPSTYIADNTDCDDAVATIHPAAPETCNSVDDDCDGDIDEDGGTIWYRDADGDGYGDPDGWVTSCAPSGVADSSDCDDTDASVRPGGTEICNSLDDDCDGDIDEDAIDPTTAYPDADGDGYGDAGGGITSCEPSGIADNTDCDDTVATIHPDAPETCNSVDDDCDGAIDEDATPSCDPPGVAEDGDEAAEQASCGCSTGTSMLGWAPLAILLARRRNYLPSPS